MPGKRGVSWKHLPIGQVVKVMEEGTHIGYGTVDGTMPDGSVVWVVLHGIGGRKMLHKSDRINLQIADASLLCLQGGSQP